MKPGSYTPDPVRVAQARMDKGLKQAEAADALHVNRVTLNKIENGRANVSLELLERMTNLYDRTREHLLGEPEHVDPIELNREQLASALSKINAGFEDLTNLVETLNDAAREAAGKTPALVEARS
jgi:transcriptional regulator with XRE-family HTH domain